MPLNSIPPTTTVKNLRIKQAAARTRQLSCDIGFWGGIIPGNAGDLLPLLRAGVKGFKCFLIDSGVEVCCLALAESFHAEDQEFPMATKADLLIACDALKVRWHSLPCGSRQDTTALILFHAELASSPMPPPSGEPDHYSTFLESRPNDLELSALDLILSLAERYPQLRFHIVHLSTADALPRIAAARAKGVSNLTVETCFHYLTIRAEDIPNGKTENKCCPPIRDEANRLRLIDGLREGIIDFVVSDHSPCLPELKKGDFISAWGGISGLGLGLSLLWTELGQSVGIAQIVDWMGGRQATQVGIAKQKGVIAPGAFADLVFFDPKNSFVVDEVGGRST